MAPRPKELRDLALAPVAVGIDLNLQRLRDKSAKEIELELQLQLDSRAVHDTSEERAERVLRLALRDVDLHGWHAAVTDDNSAIRLSGGSVSLDLGLGVGVLNFIEAAGG